MNSSTLGSDATAWIVSALIATSVAVAGLVCAAVLVSRILKLPGARSAVWTATLLWILASPVTWLLLASRPPAAPALPLGSDRPGEHDGLVPPRIDLLANLTGPDAPGVAADQAAEAGIRTDAASTVAIAAAPDRSGGSGWPFEWPQTLVAVYLLGLSIALLRSLWAWGRSATLRRAADPVDEADLAGRVAAWGKRLSLRRAPSLRSSDRIDVPCLAGIRRPVILLPEAFLGPDGSRRLVDAAIVHELVHVRRGDHWFLWLRELARVLFWFHPFVALALRRLATAQELACDEWSAWLLGSRERYADALAEVALRCAGRWPVVAAITMTRSSNVRQRIREMQVPRWLEPLQLTRVRRATITALVSIPVLLLCAAGPKPARVAADQAVARDETTQPADPPPPAAAPTPDLPIPGPETTRNVGPVRNGLVDYLAVVNRHIGAVASPKENSYALISAIFGGVKAGFVGGATPEEWLRLPADAFRAKPFVQPNNVAEEDAEKHAEFLGAFQRAKGGPWDGPDFAPVRDWLATNNEAMNRFAEAIRETKLRIPAAAPESERPRLRRAQIPWPYAFRNMADAFAVRAYRSIARGDALGALADIETILRLGAQFDQQWFLAMRLVGGGIRTKGYHALASLVRSEHVDAAILERTQKLLDAHDPPLRPYADTIVTATRWEMLDHLQRRAFGDILHAALLYNTSEGDEPKLAPAKRAALNNRFQSAGWGYAMKEVNEVFDHIEWANTQPPAKAAALLRALQQQIPTDHHGGHLQRIADDPDALLRLGVRESGRELARATLATHMCDVPGFVAREAPVRRTRESVWQLVAQRHAELNRARLRAQ